MKRSSNESVSLGKLGAFEIDLPKRVNDVNSMFLGASIRIVNHTKAHQVVSFSWCIQTFSTLGRAEQSRPLANEDCHFLSSLYFSYSA